MFQKRFLVFVLIIALLAGCATPPVSNGPAVQPVAQPQNNTVAEAAKAEATQVPAGGTFTTSDGKILVTPVPVRVPTPPVLQGEYDGLSVYYLYNPVDFQQAGLALVPVGTVSGAIALADTPLPGPADIIAFIVYGTAIVAYVAYQANVPATTIYYETPEDLTAMLALWATLSAYIPVSPEHKEAHTVVAGSSNVATQVFADLQRRWPPDPNENDPTKQVLCYVLKYGGQVMRYLVWAGTNLSATGLPRGNLSWWQYHPTTGPEAYGYGGKSLQTMQNVPKDLQGQGYTIEPSSCNNFTPPFQLLGQ